MEIQTKRNEIITVTSNVEEMIGKYLAEPLNRSWKEDFIDEDNGEVISIERFEPIYRRGQMIGPDEGAVISFHLQTGDGQYFILVAYVDSLADLRKQWPEAENLEIQAAARVEFSTRFPRPDWYKDPEV